VESQAYQGFISPSITPATRGTIVIFHGNAGLAVHRSYYIKALEPLGYRVVLAEYPGYGTRPGGLSEHNLVRDGCRTVEAARKTFGDPLFIWGESMGCAVASAVAARLKEQVHGLVLITPWNNLPALAAHHYPRYPRLLVRERFDNAANLVRYGGPTVFIVADHDEIIPLAHSQRLIAGYTGPKKLFRFPTSGHHSWPAAPDLAWWQDVMNYCDPLEQVTRR
jgi:pimeloyl-ACP methyl ester carboxylesterase